MNFLVNVIKDVSLVGSSPLLLLLALSIIIYFVIKKDMLHVTLVFLSVCSGLYSTVLKGIFSESRPLGYLSEGFIKWDRVLVWDIYSFPSTHVLMYTVFFGYLIVLSYKLKDIGEIVRRIVRYFSILMFILIGASRVLIGAHFVIDAVFGYIFGLLYLIVIIALDFKFTRK